MWLVVDDQVTLETQGRTAHVCPLLLWYLTELSSVGPGLQEERFVFADGVLMDRLLIAGFVSHLMIESRVGEDKRGPPTTTGATEMESRTLRSRQ